LLDFPDLQSFDPVVTAPGSDEACAILSMDRQLFILKPVTFFNSRHIQLQINFKHLEIQPQFLYIRRGIMKKITSKRSITINLLIASMVLSTFTVPGFSQEKPIVISVGQPNIWSLEQAHYLLARMHRQNLDLQTTPLGNIDPNETNAQRVEIVRMLISAGFSFDEALGLNNEMLKTDKTFNSQRRRDLLAQRSEILGRRAKISADITDLKIAKARTTDEDEKKRLQEQIDAKDQEKGIVDNELEVVNKELEGLSSATDDFKSADTKLEGFDTGKLPTGALSGLLPTSAAKASIAASQRLENHIGMQYEIIAKQLTLLRDEVGPGERLVFLELPQSINLSQDQEKNKYYQALRGIAGMSTNDSADNKMAQVWWRIAGFTRVNKDVLFKAELRKVEAEITKLEGMLKNKEKVDSFNVQRVGIFAEKRDELKNRLTALCAEQIRQVEKLKEAKKLSDQVACELIEYDLKLLNSAITETTEALQAIKDQPLKLEKEDARLIRSLATLYSKYEKLKMQADREKIKDQQDTIDRMWQGGGEKTSDVVAKTIDLLSQGTSPLFKKADDKNSVRVKSQTENTEYAARDGEGREYISVINDYRTQYPGSGLLRNRSVRIIDVIPRQNAVNVDTTKESVKATGIVGAFSFLFGFGGNVRYQRQKETFDEFINQELYTSGFGKGDTDFGWSFFPFNTSKQLAPGLRTTYAVAIIPDNAETIVLKAQGCYFPRREKQPGSYDATNNWRAGRESAGCLEREQIFVIPVPGGASDGSDFYVTGIGYSPGRASGERMVASIYGQNISPQIGVTIDGIALTQAVGLAQTGVESIVSEKVAENCTNQIPCGRFERISSEQIVISFKMPDGSKPGTPRITLIAPGKAIEINNLNLSVNGRDDSKLDEFDFMFGKRPGEIPRSINDFRVAPDPAGSFTTIGVVTGKFVNGDDFYVNGSLAAIDGGKCKTVNLCIIKFPNQQTDMLTVTAAPQDEKEEAVSKSFVNPVQLRITKAAVANFVKATDTKPSMLTVVIDGSGFSDAVIAAVNVPASIERRLTPTSGQMVLEIKSPPPVVHILLTDKNTNYTVSTIVETPGP
jgi:Mg2+ and Co2+ transporter CorA